MVHPANVPPRGEADKVKAVLPSDTAMSSGVQMSLLSIPELIGDEVHAWIERERRQRPGVTVGMLMHVIAKALGIVERQVYRYMSGETPFPLEKVIPFCRFQRLILIYREMFERQQRVARS